jgi:hypothetical protein
VRRIEEERWGWRGDANKKAKYAKQDIWVGHEAWIERKETGEMYSFCTNGFGGWIEKKMEMNERRLNRKWQQVESKTS